MRKNMNCLVAAAMLTIALSGCGGEAPKNDMPLSSTATNFGISEMRMAALPAEQTAGAQAALADVFRTGVEQLCVTNGKITTLPNGKLDISTGSSRAFIRRQSPQSAQIDFIYRGKSSKDVPLASGEVRRQIGLKLKALDGCNVAYAMWNVDTSRITVGVKSNPGIHTSVCGDGGYISLPSFAANHIGIGEAHSMRADLVGQELKLYMDRATAPIKITLPKEINAFDGPVGLRTDNGHFEVDFFGAAASAGPVAPPLACDSAANASH
ncbi:hypothetical protein BN2497_5723 [Janthinobacterium sp. CG23_2]|nr:hypothetical protein BN2497_5723 [Janthinobacterium sp. CG23_2]CUU29259.1 hypothetical protein BN3177_5723 [Janthinobacterium sp. CG23_2]